MHPRAAIRAYAMGLLRVAMSASGIRTFSTRIRAWHEDELPAVGVYTFSETGDVHDEAPRTYKRTLTLSVDLVPEQGPGGDGELADAADAMAKRVEDALLADPTWGGLIDDCVYAGTDTDMRAGGRDLVVGQTVRFTVTYESAAPLVDPDTLADFRTAHAEWTPKPGADDTAPMIDTVTLPSEED